MKKTQRKRELTDQESSLCLKSTLKITQNDEFVKLRC